MSATIEITRFNIPKSGTANSFSVNTGSPIFVVGGNGTGKSALVQYIVTQLNGVNVIYIPGSRANYFDQESLSMTPASRRQFGANMIGWDRLYESRWRNISGTTRNEKAIHDLQAAETQYIFDAAKDIKLRGVASASIQKLQSSNSPIDRINNIMEQSNLPTRIEVLNNEIRATQGGADYSVARMSDGERAALIISAEVIAAPAHSVFVLDEPELHLHRGITLPLLSTLLKERADCGFIVSTHELELPNEWVESSVIVVRGCTWLGDQPRYWDFDTISSSNPVPEELRLDILGSRRKILFVEGRATSLDKPLFSLMFPNVTVKARDTCRDVRQAVLGLRANQEAHHAAAFGIIDNDGLDPEQLDRFARELVFALPVFSIESLYYCPEALQAIAQQKATLGYNPVSLLADAKRKALEALQDDRSLINLASRISEQRMRSRIMSEIPDRDTMIEGGEGILVSIPSPFPLEHQNIKDLVQGGNVDAIVARYPVRESGVLAGLAKGLGFAGRADYERAVLARISIDKELMNTLRAKMDPLTTMLI